MFALFSITRGDELIPSEKKLVYVSKVRDILEDEKRRRADERARWLATHEIPWWVEASIIKEEVIEEVQEIVP